jgi:hypothetical protein
MKDQKQAIAEFWRFFQKHKVELAGLSSADHPVYDLILEKLQQINPGLYFEFQSGSGIAQLIITADGDSSLFPLVDSIVDSAPNIPGWSIFPLKPKLGFPVTTTWEGITVSIKDVVFDPLERGDSQELGLRIFVPGLIPENAKAAHNAILRALDQALGERAFAESVQYTEVLPLPDDASSEQYIALTQLENYINWRKKKQREKAGQQMH